MQNYSTYSYFVRQKHTTYSNIDRMGIQEPADDHEASSAVRGIILSALGIGSAQLHGQGEQTWQKEGDRR